MSEVVEWIDADGTFTELEVEWDLKGRFAPPVVFEEDGVPGQPGLRFRSVRHNVREFVMLVNIVADNESALRTAVRDMVARMDPTRGAGAIRVTSPVGDQREITCFYAAGLELDEKLGQIGPTLQSAPVVFRAHDPYWYAVSPIVQDFTIGTDLPSFFPILPIRLAASEIAVDSTVVNAGDVEAWPVWTITGPGDTINLRNLNTGKLLTLSGLTLTAGESAVIDTRPNEKTVIKSDGTNLWPTVSSTSSLWPIVRGVNAIRLEMGAATASSALRLSYKPRYLSP